ncbi:uncharacterized protein PGTG_06074 [Puccinia graminis f. sp. tritici CRL 75-36-700-3]|uniref:GST C-terminal domain-containing protein n=1 Tax=Puccinia graminis f. sp. tritici (strain CRL 75-36-700-3 / race SCCL) TaxID=418459 RepID=E3K5H7_PUCGT|nr:uncharacterized protein PGTG_06074 [Puccinia graminis f. sp. tritici CRL 75-36-700-3]EFP79753.2 hypothetical protein PGTG_06074 [Puccinia graminis f. sp. tritici CRL 75-36-700-3]
MKAESGTTVNSLSTNHHQPNQQHPSPTHPGENLVSGALPRTRTTTTAPGDDHSELILVGDRTSPFSQRTLFALQERKIAYRFQEATDAQKSLDATATIPTQYLPFIIYRGTAVAGGSVNLIQFLEDAFPDHHPRLLSNDLIERARERLWSDYIRQYAVPLFVRALRARVTFHRCDSTTIAGLGKVLNNYCESCIGPFFSGDQLSLPDILIAPFVFQTRLSAFPRLATAASTLVDSGAGTRYQDYANQLLKCQSLKEVLPKNDVTIENLGIQIQAMSRRISPSVPPLPPEIITQIIDELGDYELAETLEVAHHIPPTSAWLELATPLDQAILSGRLARVIEVYAEEKETRLSTWGARVMVRFGYIAMLDYLLSVEPEQLHRLCDDLLPDVASAWERVNVLEWALHGGFGIRADASESAINEASINGHVAVLEWWKNSGVALKIGNVMDYASLESTTISLEWWARSGLEGKYSRMALLNATNQGHLKVLDWWLNSGLQLVYDKEILVGATKYGKLESLEWWFKSKLKVAYTIFDIEEAIEDCTNRQLEVHGWWKHQGIDQAGSAIDWTETKFLANSQA